MFNGVINSKDVRREKAASGSQASASASCRSTGQEFDANRFLEEMAQRLATPT
jgi:hypothetical protein